MGAANPGLAGTLAELDIGGGRVKGLGDGVGILGGLGHPIVVYFPTALIYGEIVARTILHQWA